MNPIFVIKGQVLTCGEILIVKRRCATLDCHGDPGRPLRIYSETGLRALGRDRALPLDAAEIAANVESIVAVDPGAPDADHHRLVLEPLAPSAGGMHHVGGDVWLDRSDPGYVCLREWLAGRSPGTSCEVAFRTLP